MESLQLILKNEYIDQNLNIINWMTDNHEIINDNNYTIDFILINNNNIDDLAQLNITQLPTLLHKTNLIDTSNNDIFQYISNLINTKKNTFTNYSPSEHLQNYLKDTIDLKNGDNMDDTFDPRNLSDHGKKIEEHFQNNMNKSKPAKQSNIQQNNKTQNIQKKTKPAKGSDDDLLNKLFANNAATTDL